MTKVNKILEQFEEEFVANDTLDCIPEENWEEMKGEVRNFLRSAFQAFGEDLVGDEIEERRGEVEPEQYNFSQGYNQTLTNHAKEQGRKEEKNEIAKKLQQAIQLDLEESSSITLQERIDDILLTLTNNI